jgi:glutamine synthetase
MRFDTLLTMADKLMLCQVRRANVARPPATRDVMPKPIFQDNGSHAHAPVVVGAASR